MMLIQNNAKNRPDPFFILQLLGPFRPLGWRGNSGHEFELAVTKGLEDHYLRLAQVSELLARRILQIGLVADDNDILSIHRDGAEQFAQSCSPSLILFGRHDQTTLRDVDNQFDLSKVQ